MLAGVDKFEFQLNAVMFIGVADNEDELGDVSDILMGTKDGVAGLLTLLESVQK